VEVDFSVAWGRLEKLVTDALANLPNVILALVVLALFVLFGRIAKSAIGRYAHRRAEFSPAAVALARLAYGAVLVIGVLVAAAVALPTFKPGDVIQILGIGGVAIGFAFRDILQNFLAGILLLLTDPFRVGDQIVAGQFEGTVEEIQTRATLLKTYDGRRIIIPNSELFTEKVIVNTAFEKRRIEYDVAVGCGDDAARARSLILEALKECSSVLRDPAPEAFLVDLSDFSVKIRARWWITPPRIHDLFSARDEVLEVIKRKLTGQGIDLPYPTYQILLHDQTEETDGDRRRQREGWPAGTGSVPARSPRARLETATHDGEKSK
jgi:small-conductance mechanosensitive channel